MYKMFSLRQYSHKQTPLAEGCQPLEIWNQFSFMPTYNIAIPFYVPTTPPHPVTLQKFGGSHCVPKKMHPLSQNSPNNGNNDKKSIFFGSRSRNTDRDAVMKW